MALSHQAQNQRDANEPEIVGALEGVGATVHRLDQPTDLLVGYRGANYLLEVKAALGPQGGGGGRMTDTQDTFFKTWRGQRAIVRTQADALQAIGATR